MPAIARRVNGFATLSPCGLYRYELGGDLVEPPPVQKRRQGSPQLEFGPSPSIARFHMQAVAAARILLVIMLNPSKADALTTDNTITRVVCFAYGWGFRRLLVGNAYAYRSTQRAAMWAAQRKGVDIIGPANDLHLAKMMIAAKQSGGQVLVAWGKDCKPARATEVQAIAAENGLDLWCLETNEDGSPVHPLYQPGDLQPQRWPRAA